MSLQERGTESLELLRPAYRLQSLGDRVWVTTLLFVGFVIAVLVTMITGYRSQAELRLQERTREISVAYETVTSTLAATPELFRAQLARDPYVTGIMAEANRDAGATQDQLRARLYTHLRDDYAILREADFRQLHFQLTNNHSFLRFHRPERYGDDLTEARPTVRVTNHTQTPTYGFEEGRIYNGFRFVYPLFHAGAHVGSVEASLSYQAVISRMRSSRPMVYDFVLSRHAIESIVFEEEQDNYEPFVLSDRFARESAYPHPDTGTVIGVDFGDVLTRGARSARLIRGLETYTATSVALMVGRKAIAVSLVPLRNYAGENVAFIIGYSRIDELFVLRRFFIAVGVALALLSGAVFALFLRILRHRHRLMDLSKDLQRTIQSKDRFYSIVAHDLRGPMGALAGLSEMLKEELHAVENLPHDTREVADALAEGSNNSFNLLTDLLDWSRAQGGDISFQPTELALAELVTDQFSTLHRLAAGKTIILKNLVDGLTVYADKYMLKTVLRNLLSNGIKFTPDGGTVSVLARTETDGVEILVTDTGVGMTEKQRIDALNPAIKTSTRGTKSESGTGLGLTVCMEFVRQHGGTIAVESEVGIGTTFRVWLPGCVTNPVETAKRLDQP